MLKQKLEKVRSSKHTHNVGVILSILFPVFLVLLAEVNQAGTLSILNKFIFETPMILIFDIILVGSLFVFFTLLLKKVYLSSLIIGLLFFIISCVEFYRFAASGAHFTLGDFSLFTNVGDVAEFAKIEIHFIMVFLLFLLLAYIFVLWMLDMKFSVSWKKRIAACSVILVYSLVFFMVPAVNNVVFQAFGINNEGPNNTFGLAERFHDNGMIAFLADNTTDMIETINIKKPDNYSPQAIQTMALALGQKNIETKAKPNVIMIMSESYTDFRRFPELNIGDTYYQNFDQFKAEGHTGNAIVPTFGGYTVKTEFELLFGLPIKSLNATAAPQSLINENEQTTIASYYKSQGYATSYMHPYTPEFYDRGELFQRYHFDNLYFQKDFGQNRFHSYIDDSVPFQKAVDQIKQDDAPSYIHITTMQNHMPYNNDPSLTQMQYYMNGIKQTDLSLGALMDALENLEEPTVVMFIGDHFPFFTDENNAYDTLGIDSSNCLQLYEQPYFVWSNYGDTFEDMPDTTVSAFYLPHLLIQGIGLPGNDLVELMLDQVKTDPVYTMEFDSIRRNQKLDTITYDLILGDQYTNRFLK